MVLFSCRLKIDKSLPDKQTLSFGGWILFHWIFPASFSISPTLAECCAVWTAGCLKTWRREAFPAMSFRHFTILPESAQIVEFLSEPSAYYLEGNNQLSSQTESRSSTLLMRLLRRNDDHLIFQAVEHFHAPPTKQSPTAFCNHVFLFVYTTAFLGPWM